jgi:hypothetical protein
MQVRWNIADKSAFLVTLLIAIYYLALAIMPRLEGAVLPVTSLATLTSYEPAPPPEWRGVWAAEATKLRECDYVLGSIRWYLGQPGGRTQRVHAKFEDAPEIRSKGVLDWDGLVIDLDPDVLLTNSYAIVVHQCPWRWWETETVFYLSGQSPDKVQITHSR